MQLLKIDDFKPIGAFIENTIRPIMSELKSMGVDISMDGLNKALTKLVIAHIVSSIFYTIRDITVIAIIGYVCIKSAS